MCRPVTSLVRKKRKNRSICKVLLWAPWPILPVFFFFLGKTPDIRCHWHCETILVQLGGVDMGVPLAEPSIHRHRYRAGLYWLGCTSLSTGTRDIGWLDNKETVTLVCDEAVPASLPEIGISGEIATSLPILTLGWKPLQRWLHGMWSSAHSNKPGATSRGASSVQLPVSLWEGLYSSQHLSYWRMQAAGVLMLQMKRWGSKIYCYKCHQTGCKPTWQPRSSWESASVSWGPTGKHCGNEPLKRNICLCF